MSNSLSELKPNKLFRYRSCDTEYFEGELFEAVINQKAYFSSLSSQNDPFECNPTVYDSSIKELAAVYKGFGKRYIVSEDFLASKFPTLSKKKLKKLLKENFRVTPHNLDKQNAVLRRLSDRIRDGSKIICLSEKPDINLMWSHYSSGLNGVVLQYEVEWFTMDVTNDDPPIQVDYVLKRPKISTADMVAFFEASRMSDGRKKFVESISKVSEAYIRQKSEDWRYEYEWRIQKRDMENNGYRFVPSLKVDRVIIGTRVSEGTQKKIHSICQGKVKIAGIKLDVDEYRLRIVEV